MYSRSVSSFCIKLSSCRVGGCRVGPPPAQLPSWKFLDLRRHESFPCHVLPINSSSAVVALELTMKNCPVYHVFLIIIIIHNK